MPIWVPPSPPRDDNDVYIDRQLALNYEMEPMAEDRLPPIWVNKRELKKMKIDAAAASQAGLKTEAIGAGAADVNIVIFLFWAAVPKGQCPVGCRGKFRISILLCIRPPLVQKHLSLLKNMKKKVKY